MSKKPSNLDSQQYLQEKLLSMVLEAIKNHPMYPGRSAPEPGEREFSGMASKIIEDILKKKYKQAGLDQVSPPPRRQTIQKWFSRGLPLDAVLLISQ
jgi:hypothetical protein